MKEDGRFGPEAPGGELRSIDVVVPTWKRPDYLRGAIEGLLEQTVRPRRIIPVARPDDRPTWEALDGMRDVCKERGVRLHPLEVDRPGFLAPLIRAQREVESEIVVIHDDDARAEVDFLERLTRHYGEDKVVGVGGRCIGYYQGELLRVSSTRRAAYFSWLGHPIGRMDRPMNPEHPIRASFLSGGAASYRNEVFASFIFPKVLDRDVAMSYEVVIGAQARRRGVLVYDPTAVLHHFTGSREAIGLRPEGVAPAEVVMAARRQALWNTSFSYQYGAPPGRRQIGLLLDLLVGTGLGPGPAYGFLRPGRHQSMNWREAARIKWNASVAARVARKCEAPIRADAS